MKKVFLLVGASLVAACIAGLSSCDLTLDPTRMKGEALLPLEPAQRDRLTALFGAEFVADSGSHLYVADFTVNSHHPVLAGRQLAGVYDPSIDKIWINYWFDTEAVVAHELTHRWQNRVLRDPFPSSQDRLTMDYQFADDQVQTVLDTGVRLNCEQEANLVSLYYDSYVTPDPRHLLFLTRPNGAETSGPVTSLPRSGSGQNAVLAAVSHFSVPGQGDRGPRPPNGVDAATSTTAPGYPNLAALR